MTLLAVDGAGLARPMAGVGTYTRRLIAAMAARRPDASLVVHVPPGSRLKCSDDAGTVEARPQPSARLLGRHALLPLALRSLRPDAYLACSGSVPLGGAGCPTLVTAHDLANDGSCRRHKFIGPLARVGSVAAPHPAQPPEKEHDRGERDR